MVKNMASLWPVFMSPYRVSYGLYRDFSDSPRVPILGNPEAKKRALGFYTQLSFLELLPFTRPAVVHRCCCC